MSTDRASVPQILADLILVGRDHDLPNPQEMSANGRNDIVSLYFDTPAALDVWSKVLGGGGVRSHEHAKEPGRWLHSNERGIHRRGWYLLLSAATSGPSGGAGLDAETVAGLDAVAGRKPLVSDETIRQAEQISRMVPATDIGLPKAECGCPIKRAGLLGVFVDHCENCEVTR